MTVLGVNCNTHCAFFAVAVNGELSTGPVEYIEAPNLVESSEELKSVLDELTRVIKEVNADKVVLLKPEGGRRRRRMRRSSRGSRDDGGLAMPR